MQQLLTGKQRLPGFSGEWESKSIGEIGQVVTGNTPPTRDPQNYGDEYLFVSPVNLGVGKTVLNTEKRLSKMGFSIARKLPKNSILFTCIGSTIGKTGVAGTDLASNQQINSILPNETYDTDL